MLNHLKKQFEYDLWANILVLDTLIDNQINDEKSIMWINHIVNAEIIWIDRIEVGSISIRPFELRSLKDCKTEMIGINNRIHAYLNRVSEDEIRGELVYLNTRGIEFKNNIKDILAHLVNHSTHHRAQIVARIRELDIAPPQTDYIFFLR